MKYIKQMCVISLISFFSSNVFASGESHFVNLSGDYTCNGQDRIDKTLSGTTLILTLDSKNSVFNKTYGAYQLRWIAPSKMKVHGLPKNIQATGVVVTWKSHFAISFKNTNRHALTDYGTGVGVVKNNSTLQFFSYQPTYKNGDNSTWTCVKHSVKK